MNKYILTGWKIRICQPDGQIDKTKADIEDIRRIKKRRQNRYNNDTKKEKNEWIQAYVKTDEQKTRHSKWKKIFVWNAKS